MRLEYEDSPVVMRPQQTDNMFFKKVEVEQEKLSRHMAYPVTQYSAATPFVWKSVDTTPMVRYMGVSPQMISFPERNFNVKYVKVPEQRVLVQQPMFVQSQQISDNHRFSVPEKVSFEYEKQEVREVPVFKSSFDDVKYVRVQDPRAEMKQVSVSFDKSDDHHVVPVMQSSSPVFRPEAAAFRKMPIAQALSTKFIQASEVPVMKSVKFTRPEVDYETNSVVVSRAEVEPQIISQRLVQEEPEYEIKNTVVSPQYVQKVPKVEYETVAMPQQLVQYVPKSEVSQHFIQKTPEFEKTELKVPEIEVEPTFIPQPMAKHYRTVEIKPVAVSRSVKIQPEMVSEPLSVMRLVPKIKNTVIKTRNVEVETKKEENNDYEEERNSSLEK